VVDRSVLNTQQEFLDEARNAGRIQCIDSAVAVQRIDNRFSPTVLGDLDSTFVNRGKAVKETFGPFIEKRWSDVAAG
jgi:hypothetical protein